MITAFRGSSDRSEVYAIDRQGSDRSARPAVHRLLRCLRVHRIGRRSAAFSNRRRGAARTHHRDRSASNRSSRRRELVPESGDKLSSAAVIHQTIVAAYMHNASDTLRLFTLDGEPAGHVDLPAIGSLTGISGRPDDDGDVSGVHVVRRIRRRIIASISPRGELAPFGQRHLAFRFGSIRNAAGLVPLEGRHAGVDVPGLPKGTRRRTAIGRCS